jgi:tRNA threonylcarbamoyladenosine biosynthesis protein TsaB
LALILNIDTATEQASVCLSNNEEVIGLQISTDQKNHASFIQPAIEKIMQETSRNLSAIDAIAVTAGPGSYTGLRVGLATAKGICYALNKPLITINTLQVMAYAAMQNCPDADGKTLFCPMIDARRMEVFTATYNNTVEEITPPSALILDETSFYEQLNSHLIIFSGSGHIKLKSIIQHPNAIFSAVQHNASHLVMLALKAFTAKHFADMAYTEPFYLKEFFTPAKH